MPRGKCCCDLAVYKQNRIELNLPEGLTSFSRLCAHCLGQWSSICICHRLTEQHWRTVLFTDENKFSLSTCDRCELIWRRPEEWDAPCNTIQHDQPGFLLVHDFTWWEYAGISWRMNDLIPLTGLHGHLTLIQLNTSLCVGPILPG